MFDRVKLVEITYVLEPSMDNLRRYYGVFLHGSETFNIVRNQDGEHVVSFLTTSPANLVHAMGKHDKHHRLFLVMDPETRSQLFSDA